MLRQKLTPSSNPKLKPMTPRLALAMKKTRVIAPLVAPIVRRMAMSRLLFFTSMTMPEMMFRAAMATTRQSRTAAGKRRESGKQEDIGPWPGGRTL